MLQSWESDIGRAFAKLRKRPYGDNDMLDAVARFQHAMGGSMTRHQEEQMAPATSVQTLESGMADASDHVQGERG
jgi:hypothetical protein